MAKQLKTDHGKVDRISNLPDAVLCHILSFLSTKQAVSTSLLSARWRYLFVCVSNLDLDDTLFWVPNTNKHATVRKFFNFVDRMLFFRTKTNLEKLRLCVTEDTSCVYSWISAAATLRGVRQLDLCFSKSKQSIKLPNVLFTCKTLVVLKLYIATALYVPSEVCLPNLKTLHLKYAGFMNDSIQRLISSCIILEDFYIKCFGSNISQVNICHTFLKRLTMIIGGEDLFNACVVIDDSEDLSNASIVIDAPSLVYLKYYAKIAAGYSLRNLNSLVNAKIALFLDKDDIQTSEFSSANELFRGIANVKSLMLRGDILARLICQEPLHLFDKLVELKINPHFIGYQVKEFFDLLQSMPNLEKLSFPCEVGRLLATYLPENVPSCLLYHLKMIEISYFSRYGTLENLKFLLRSASVLEKLTVHAFYLDENEKLKIAEELLASPRKSKKCSILVV